MNLSSPALNIRQAAELLGVHEQTVRRLARTGKIPAFKVGRDWRFSREALERWVETQHPSEGNSCTCTALVIDDEQPYRALLARMVEKIGCRAHQCSGAAEGLESIHHVIPDLILLDLKMPEMNGAEFLGHLRKTHPSIPVIVVTGYPDSALVNRAMQHAPVMLLPKPVDQKLLERTVRSVVGGKLKDTNVD